MKTAEHIIETVDKLVRKYHTRDPYELCQLLGIKIHYYDLQKKLKGFFYYQSRQKNIVIDHNVNGILERILVAHELGHAVLHVHDFGILPSVHLGIVLNNSIPAIHALYEVQTPRQISGIHCTQGFSLRVRKCIVGSQGIIKGTVFL